MNPFLIMKEVEKYYGVDRGSICSPSRTKARSEARTIAMALCRAHTRFSYPELGEIFEKTHKSVMEAVERVKKREDLRAIIKDIENILISGSIK